MANSNRNLTINQLAQALGIGESTLRRYQKQGMPFDSGGQRSKANKYSATEVIEWMEGKGLTGERGAPLAGGVGVTEEMRAEQLRKIKAQADVYEQSLKQARMEYERERGELLLRSEVEKGRIERIQFVKNGLLGLPSSLAPQLVGQDAPTIQARIEEEVYRLLEWFSRQ